MLKQLLKTETSVGERSVAPAFAASGDVCLCFGNFEYLVESVLFVACLGSNAPPREELFDWLRMDSVPSF